jgi:large subunit ribosomal protein L18
MRYHYKSQLNARQRRHLRVRAKVRGSEARPRLNVFRSSAHIYAQVIDDAQGHTLVSASSREPDVVSRLADDKTNRQGEDRRVDHRRARERSRHRYGCL